MPMHPCHWFSSTDGYWYHATSVHVWVSSARWSTCSSSLLTFSGAFSITVFFFLFFLFYILFLFTFSNIFSFFHGFFSSFFLPPLKLSLELALRLSQMPKFRFQRLDDSRLPCGQCHFSINAPEKKYKDKDRKYRVHFKSLIKYDCQWYMFKVMALFTGLNTLLIGTMTLSVENRNKNHQSKDRMFSGNINTWSKSTFNKIWAGQANHVANLNISFSINNFTSRTNIVACKKKHMVSVVLHIPRWS